MRHHNDYNRTAMGLIRRDRFPDAVKLDVTSQWAHYWVFAAMVLMLALSLYLFLNTSQLIERLQSRLAGVEDSDSVRIRQYQQQLNALQERMTVFVADSVETKLKTLERSVADGTVGMQEIKALEELKGEVKLLEKYSAGKGGNLTDLSQLEHPRFQITSGSQNPVSSGDLLLEVSQMKRLLYLGIASCGFAGLMLGGYWWHSHSRVKRLSKDMPVSRLIELKAEED